MVSRARRDLRTPSRCFGEGDPLYERYHDEEWGRPVLDDRGLYERLCLEAFQAGLAWRTVLYKREAFRAAFAGFEPERVAEYRRRDIERLLRNTAIIRNRAKLEAAVTNARAVRELWHSGTSLAALLWSFAPQPRKIPRRISELPASTSESEELAKALRRHGFRFVGPTTAYATMQAAGLVNDHLLHCVARDAVERERTTALCAPGKTPQTKPARR